MDDAESYARHLTTGRARTRREFEGIGADGRAIIYAADWAPPPEIPDPAYPLHLNTGRLVYHWHTRTKTARNPHLHLLAPEAYAEINPVDAAARQIEPGERVRVSTRRGSIEVLARVTDAVFPGMIFIPFHFGGLRERQAANELTLDVWDVVSKQPLYKNGAACQVEKAR